MKCLFLLLFPLSLLAQDIPPKAKTIIVNNISYSEVLEALLDKGYEIENKDSDLQTVRTGPIVYPKHWNGAYKILVRVKDSTARFSGIYLCPYDTQFASLLFKQSINEAKWNNDTYIFNRTNKKGEPQKKSMEGYPFHLMNEFVLSLGKEVSYE